MGNRNDDVNRQSIQFNVRKEPRKLWHEGSGIHDNRRRNNRRNFDTDDSKTVESRKKLDRNRTIRKRSTRRSRVNLYNQEI